MPTDGGVVMNQDIFQCDVGETICLPSYFSECDQVTFLSRTLKRGEHLIYQGQTSRYLYILRSGVLKSYTTKQNGDEFVMGFYFPPDLFGWEVIDEHQRSVSIVALDNASVCMIPADKLFSMTQKDPVFGSRLLGMISRRIQQDNMALLRTTARQRVAVFLLQLALRYAEIGFSQNHLQLKMTYYDIANYLRITPGTISRIFRQWVKAKLIIKKNHQISLIDREAIELIAENG